MIESHRNYPGTKPRAQEMQRGTKLRFKMVHLNKYVHPDLIKEIPLQLLIPVYNLKFSDFCLLC